MVSRHFAFMGDNSFRAAEASECAADQGKYWEYRELVYGKQGILRSITGDPAGQLKAWATELGLNQASFGACCDSGKYRSLVLAEAQVARDLKVPGTPAIFVDDRMLTGPDGGLPSPEELQKAVDQAIARKGR